MARLARLYSVSTAAHVAIAAAWSGGSLQPGAAISLVPDPFERAAPLGVLTPRRFSLVPFLFLANHDIIE
jgi:hypothetical protein